MHDFHETTSANLRAIREAKHLTQGDVATLLGLENHNVSKIEKGIRALSEAEKKILDWHFFGIVPLKIDHTTTTLDFDETEWQTIGQISRRLGMTEREWITQRIREHLAILRAPLPAGKATA